MLGERYPERDHIPTRRIDVSVTKECIEAIDDLIESSMLFNGRSDFVIQALRYFTINYMATAKELLDEKIHNYGSTRLAIKKYEDAMRNLGDQLDNNFRDTFGGKLTEQIPIRINEDFFTRLKDMNELSPLGIQAICRMAIKDYYGLISKDVEDLNHFCAQYNDLVNKLKFMDSIEDEDLLSRFERNKPRRS